MLQSVSRLESGETLLELLRFSAESYVKLNDYLSDLETKLNGDETETFPDAPALTGNALPLSDERKQEAHRILQYSKFLCAKIHLQVCMKHSDELLASVERGWLGAGDVRALRDNVKRELSCQHFVGIPPECQPLFENARQNWDDVLEAFPNAVDDVEEMNRCYALCRYAAAVSHSLLVVEHGLVALGPRIGATDPKEGWDASCRQLERVMKAGRAANGTGLDFDQLDQLNTCMQVMKTAWRNKVNHATGKPIVLHGGFAPDVADDIIKASRGFMRRLAIVLSSPVVP